MQSITSRGLRVVLTAAIAVMVAMPVAAASADSRSGSAASGKAAKKIKALERRTAALAQQLAALEATTASLASREAPTALPPIGFAGGVLTGSYPRPGLGASTVGSLNIIDGTVQSADVSDGTLLSTDIGDGQVRGPDLSAGIVGASNLKEGIFEEVGPGVTVQPGETKETSVACRQGTRLLGGGIEWANTRGNGTAVISSGPNVSIPNTMWTVQGRVDAGTPTAAANTLFAVALCLAA
jgi:hypothetical protein